MIKELKNSVEKFGDITFFVKEDDVIYFNEAYISEGYLNITEGYFNINDYKNIETLEVNDFVANSVNAIVVSEEDYNGEHLEVFENISSIDLDNLKSLSLSEAIDYILVNNANRLAFLPKY